MSPQERSTPASKPVPNGGFSVRKLPGFTAAAVAFVLVVLLGVGGIAVAKWNQSANVTVGITAGAAPAPAGQGNIVASPAIALRPAAVAVTSCTVSRNSGNYVITWDRNAISGVSYLVTLTGTSESKILSTNSATSVNFSLANSNAAYGNYTVRIQPMRGEVAGDPVEITINHGRNSQSCKSLGPTVGKFAVRGVPEKYPLAVLNLNWDPAANATSYKVSIKARDSSYGAEFTTSSLAATLTFPRTVWPSSYGDYDLRIQPMIGDQADSPVYKVIQFYPFSVPRIL